MRSRLASTPLLNLVALRWRMVRDPAVRRRVRVLALVPVLLLGTAVAGGLAIPDDRRLEISVLLPTIAFATVLVAVIAPLVAGGGNELYPRDQLVAYPVDARTTYLGSLLLAPLNVAWLLQLVLLVTVTSVAVGASVGLPLAMVSILTFTILATVVGQSLAWAVAAVRATSSGRRATQVALTVLAVSSAAVVLTGNTSGLLDRGPSGLIVTVVFDAAALDMAPWTLTVVVMLGASVLAGQLGVVAVRWGQRRPDWSKGSNGSTAAARSSRRSGVDDGRLVPVHAELAAVDRASVWRSPALRRGLLVLGVLPGAAAAASRLDWSTLPLLPTLTAAAAGLLFGVNAFGLDGSGATWLGSLPGWAGPAFWAKTRVIAETCALASVLAIVGGALGARSVGTSTQITAVLGATLAGVSVVCAIVVRLSVRHPHHSPLDGPRDAPAPPGSMAGYSLRLAVPCTVVGLAFGAVARGPAWWFPLVLTVPFVCWAAASVLNTASTWRQPETRANVVSRVAAG